MAEKRAYRKWTTGENQYLMMMAHRISWEDIAAKVNRTPKACEAQFRKIVRIREANGTWKGLGK